MKSKYFLLAKSILFVFFFSAIAVYAFVELNKEETFTIESPSFFPFTSSINTQVKEQLPTNPLYDVSFLDVTGGPLTVSAAADSQEFGPRLTVSAQGIFTVDFSTIPPSANSLGLSFVPLEGSTTFTFSVSQHVVSGVSNSGVSSSSSGGQISLQENRPNSLVIFSLPLEESAAQQLFNKNTNLRCLDSFTSVNIGSANSILSDAGSLDDLILNRFSSLNPDHHVFIVNPPGSVNSEGAFFVNELMNPVDVTQVYLTAIFPAIISDTQTTVISEIATLNQTLELGRLSLKYVGNGAFYNPKDGECFSPYCAFINNGEVLFFPNGNCVALGIAKKNVIFNPFILPDFLSQLPSNVNTSKVEIDLPLVSGTNIVSMIISADIVKEKSYVIFQAVPAKSKIKQILTIKLAAKKKRQCSENSTSKTGFCGENNAQCVSKEFLGKCCEANTDGTVKRICHPANAFTCNCTENFAGTAFASLTSAEPDDDKPRKCPKEFFCGGCKNNGKCCLRDNGVEVARCGPTPFAPGMCSCQAI